MQPTTPLPHALHRSQFTPSVPPTSASFRHCLRNRIAQTTAFWLFRFATYAILAAATYIFLDIGIKGSRTLFTTSAPFINVPFFTQGPQTLFVFDYEGKKYT